MPESRLQLKKSAIGASSVTLIPTTGPNTTQFGGAAISQIVVNARPVRHPDVPWGSSEKQMVSIPRERRVAVGTGGVDRRTQIHGPVPRKVHALTPGDVQVVITERVGREARAIRSEVQREAVPGDHGACFAE